MSFENRIPDIMRVTGSFVAIMAVSVLSFEFGAPLFMASLGASAVILFAMPGSKAARPRSVLSGHVLSALIGVSMVHLMGPTWLAVAIAVAASISVMMALDIVHPPGGATALIAVTTCASWDFVVAPVLLGSLILLLVSSVVERVNNRSVHSGYRSC